jgi:hypothetical protein
MGHTAEREQPRAALTLKMSIKPKAGPLDLLKGIRPVDNGHFKSYLPVSMIDCGQ